VEPRVLEVTADLARNAEVSVTLPLAVFRDADGAGPHLRVLADPARPWVLAGEPPRIAIVLRGTPRSLAAVAPQTIRAFVVASEMPPGVERGDLRVHTSDLPSGVALAKEDLSVPVEIAR
jgi:hypothetical protein